MMISDDDLLKINIPQLITDEEDRRYYWKLKQTTKKTLGRTTDNKSVEVETNF